MVCIVYTPRDYVYSKNSISVRSDPWLIMFYYKNDWIHIVTFFLVNLCIKGIPLWTVRNDPYRWKDFYALVVYFIMYIIWLFVNDQLHTRGIEKGLQQIKDNVPSGPFMQFVDKSIRV